MMIKNSISKSTQSKKYNRSKITWRIFVIIGFISLSNVDAQMLMSEKHIMVKLSSAHFQLSSLSNIRQKLTAYKYEIFIHPWKSMFKTSITTTSMWGWGLVLECLYSSISVCWTLKWYYITFVHIKKKSITEMRSAPLPLLLGAAHSDW